ncbi:acylphosphatase [Amorphus suaedae]
MSDRSVHVVIAGMLQGVGYRSWLAQIADSYELGGWVRDRMTGEIEAVFSGPSEVVAEMIAECRKGPPGSNVTSVSVQEYSHTINTPFEVRETS